MSVGFGEHVGGERGTQRVRSEIRVEATGIACLEERRMREGAGSITFVHITSTQMEQIGQTVFNEFFRPVPQYHCAHDYSSVPATSPIIQPLPDAPIPSRVREPALDAPQRAPPQFTRRFACRASAR
jgi:hypothetical protein